MNLKQRTFSAVRWTTLAMCSRSTIQFVQIATLARMLEPSDFGLMAMVLAVVTFIRVFSDLGVSNAIIHHQDISGDQLSSLYWLNVITGAVLMLVLMLASSWIGEIVFDQQALQPVLTAVSVSILLTAMGQQVRVMAEKALNFATLAKIEIIASFAGFISAVSWAWFSPGVYALVAAVLVSASTQTVLLWLFAAQGWRPGFRLYMREIRKFLSFGGYMVANSFINSINSQIDILIAGKMFSATTLGIYSVPRNLSLTIAGAINPVVTRVGLPVMATTQGDQVFLKSVYLKTMRMTASINFPIYIALAAFSEEIVLVVFGEKWADSAPLLVFLAIWGMFRSCGNPVGSLLIAVGRADLSFKWNVALLFVVPPALFIASGWGVMGLAVGQSILTFSLLLPAWYVLVKPHCGAGFNEYFLSLMGPLLSAFIAVLLGYVVAVSLSTPIWRLVTAAVVAIPAYIIFSYAFNRAWLVAMRQLLSGAHRD